MSSVSRQQYNDHGRSSVATAVNHLPGGLVVAAAGLAATLPAATCPLATAGLNVQYVSTESGAMRCVVMPIPVIWEYGEGFRKLALAGMRDFLPPGDFQVGSFARCSQSHQQRGTQRWSRHVPKPRNTSRMPEA